MAHVEGVVTVEGEPLPTGTIRFIPEDGGRSARGEIESDGTFTLGTFTESDGALIGKHGVAVTAYSGDAQTGDVERDVPTRRPLVHPRYGSASGSQITYEVKSGTNNPEFDLERPP